MSPDKHLLADNRFFRTTFCIENMIIYFMNHANVEHNRRHKQYSLSDKSGQNVYRISDQKDANNKTCTMQLT